MTTEESRLLGERPRRDRDLARGDFNCSSWPLKPTDRVCDFGAAVYRAARVAGMPALCGLLLVLATSGAIGCARKVPDPVPPVAKSLESQLCLQRCEVRHGTCLGGAGDSKVGRYARGCPEFCV
jgi:hypothetical protein